MLTNTALGILSPAGINAGSFSRGVRLLCGPLRGLYCRPWVIALYTGAGVHWRRTGRRRMMYPHFLGKYPHLHPQHTPGLLHISTHVYALVLRFIKRLT